MRKNFASRAVGLVPVFILLGSGCSLVYDLSPDQCGSNADCVRFGDGLTCDSGICTCHDPVCMNNPTGGGAAGGTGGKGGGNGGTSAMGGSSASGGTATGGDAGMTEMGGMGGTDVVGGTGGSTGGTGAKGGTSAKGGTGGTGGTSGGDAGAAGAEPVIECTTHNDCFTLYPEDSDTNPRACVENKCVPLKTEDCPVVLPNYDKGVWNTLRSTNAIILGAFAPLNGDSLDTIGRNYDLAVTELSQEVHGVFAGGTNRKELVFVVCHNLFSVKADLLAPARHLMEELKVPGVVSALLLEDQKYVWENVAQANGTFMMMPLYSDQALINEPDNGLIWHMLSGADALSVSYQPLFDLTVDHLKGLGSLGAAEDVRVAHVKATDEQFLHDTGDYIEGHLQFNGQSCLDNADLYMPISIKSSYSAPADTQATAIESILDFAPHIVIGSTMSEMLKQIIPGVEGGWEAQNPGRDRPFYLLGALDYNDPEMPQTVDNPVPSGQKPLYQRILGVNWPGAADRTVYNAYQARFKSAYGAAIPDYENFYDAMYYLMYGVAAARQPLSGDYIAKGLLRVTDPNGTAVEVGPNDDMETYVGQLNLNTQTKIELMGAMGPPNWDQYGSRNDPGSIWCVNTIGVYAADQMRYNAGGTLDGKISCFPFADQP